MACRTTYGDPLPYAGFEENIFREIRNAGFETYISDNKIPIESAFIPKTRSVCCTDEGIDDGFIRDPGGGTCHPEGIEYAAQIFVDAHVKKTTYHRGCARIKKRIMDELKIPAGSHIGQDKINEFAADVLRLPPGNYRECFIVDEYARVLARDLADKMNEIIRGKGINCAPVECSEVSALNRPKDYHNAQCVYINTTYEPFAPLRAAGMPNGFGLSAAYFKGKDVIDNIKTVISIAFGPEGYRKGFTEENPFILAVIKDPYHRGTSIKIKNDIGKIIESPTYEHYGRVILDEFTAPKNVASICAPHHTSVLDTIGNAFINAENAVLDALNPDEHKYPHGI